MPDGPNLGGEGGLAFPCTRPTAPSNPLWVTLRSLWWAVISSQVNVVLLSLSSINLQVCVICHETIRIFIC